MENESTRKKRVSERKRVKCIERRAKKGEREVGAEGENERASERGLVHLNESHR